MIRGVLRAGVGLSLVVVAALGGVAAEAAGPVALPEPPRLSVDTTYVPPSGRTVAVVAGGDFQAALNRAQPGDVITLEAGAVFTGPFRLPNKAGAGWIIVRTSAPDSSLPRPGTRIDPSYAGAMPKLVAASEGVITAAPGAHHYRFIGIEMRPRDGVHLHSLVWLGNDEIAPEALPHHIVVDRCYLHGDPKKGSRRGIALNSRDTAVVDSYLSDFKEAGAEAQAIGGWNGPGPFKIVNNYLEGAGENIMFGGTDPSIPDLVPADIEIRRNHLSKPVAWKAGEPGHEGTAWTVKNLLELKNARRVLIEGNVLEHNWVQAQTGFAVLFTVRNQDGRAPWATVEDVTFVNNIVRHAAAGISMHGRDNNQPSQRTKRILIRNNLFEDVGDPRWGGGGRLFQILDGIANLVIEHNTAVQTGNIILAEGAPHEGFVYRDNITPHNEYGMIGTGTPPGNPTIERYFPRAVIEKNVIVGGRGGQYPGRNFAPGSLADVGFVDPARGDYRLADGSRYKKAGTEGKDPGVDMDELAAALSADDRRAAAGSGPAPARKE